MGMKGNGNYDAPFGTKVTACNADMAVVKCSRAAWNYDGPFGTEVRACNADMAVVKCLRAAWTGSRLRGQRQQTASEITDTQLGSS